MSPELAIKIVVEKRALLGSNHPDQLQRVATVYINGIEYRALAPPKAVGDALDWMEQLRVHRPNPEEFGSEIIADPAYSILVKKLLKEELEKTRSGEGGQNNVNAMEPFYHVLLRLTEIPLVEVKFDLRREELEKRILEPYRNLRAFVVNGRTILTENLERIQVFETPHPSSKFREVTLTAARSGSTQFFYFEDGVKDATDQFVTTPTTALLPSRTDAIELLCSRFHTVAMQLRDRRSNRPTLDVADEYDVQDLLHALLRVFFEDVRPEEWTPSYAGSSSRMDFLLPAEHTVIETKKTRPGLRAKELGSELIEDIARYRVHPGCKRLVCFVYDPDGHVANPRGIEHDLSRNEDGFEVKVIIAPKGY